MSAQQLRLFPAAKPLVERLGDAFFRSIPRAPGVYQMFDVDGRLLYVGKAKDLRSRLGSYRRTHGQARKTVRLIHTAARIEWEICPSETLARLLEQRILRTLRPGFNRAGVWPHSARFIRVSETGAGFQLGVESEPAAECYGAFRAAPALALGALARLFWFASSGDPSVAGLPHRLVRNAEVRRCAVECPESSSMLGEVREFFSGASDRLLSDLLGAIPEPASSFDATFVALQFELLLDFFRRGPLQNRELRRRFPGGSPLVFPEELDDLRVLSNTVIHPDQVSKGLNPSARGCEARATPEA